MAKKKEAENQSVVEYNEKITNLPETIPQEGVEEITIARKLLSLYNLQQICSQIDKIRVIRGELPNEVRDLEDALEGMQTRIEKHKEELEELQQKIVAQDVKMKESAALIKRYEEQQNNVRNNREYESLSKEIEYQKLEIQVAEKHKGKFSAEIVTKTEDIAVFEEKRKEIEEILTQKKNELAAIIADTKKEEQELIEKSNELKKSVDHRLLSAFERIRNNARNGLALVLIERDACGGCFSKIPPQRQLDIRLHKKIIVCEACGRIFIDKQLVESQNLSEA
ncbi:MAG: C4-type zinc ribbon domain-containing protein [Bacteroidetes bacterium]|nr:C4-type zinc ribbon domain-containing protein [Bacteroidota bacterium]MCL2303557.1 C4-type zinc ribbon domain-containing protein [Lentimicrobiaceae bacterium]